MPKKIPYYIIVELKLLLFGVKYVIGIITFYQFLLEEAIQAGLMACYINTVIRKQGRTAAIIEQLKNHTIPALEEYNRDWGYIALFNREAFRVYAIAARLAVRAYEESK